MAGRLTCDCSAETCADVVDGAGDRAGLGALPARSIGGPGAGAGEWRSSSASNLRHPELKVSTPAHIKHQGWCLEFEFRVTHPATSAKMESMADTPSCTSSSPAAAAAAAAAAASGNLSTGGQVVRALGGWGYEMGWGCMGVQTAGPFDVPLGLAGLPLLHHLDGVAQLTLRHVRPGLAARRPAAALPLRPRPRPPRASAPPALRRLLSSGQRAQRGVRLDVPSRRRDCHSAAPPSTFSRRFNSDGERASAK